MLLLFVGHIGLFLRWFFDPTGFPCLKIRKFSEVFFAVAISSTQLCFMFPNSKFGVNVFQPNFTIYSLLV